MAPMCQQIGRCVVTPITVDWQWLSTIMHQVLMLVVSSLVPYTDDTYLGLQSKAKAGPVETKAKITPSLSRTEPRRLP